MTPRRRAVDREPWILRHWQLLAAVVAGAMWLGALEARVTHLEQFETYFHGSVDLPTKGR